MKTYHIIQLWHSMLYFYPTATNAYLLDENYFDFAMSGNAHFFLYMI